MGALKNAHVVRLFQGLSAVPLARPSALLIELEVGDFGNLGRIRRGMSSRSPDQTEPKRAQKHASTAEKSTFFRTQQKHRSGGSIAFAAIRPFRPAHDNTIYN
ncbi:hypothetical protein L596_009833 [Steinernema carpocapsae]|uniref:Uncharacterized protein n=1 Tax=Steinernema carpocapsae TaxID=34508 RepID=A0A4U5PHB2_STECR|nr:hypothetical protein L596_009833 [Steinernema carpocapsae]